MLVSIIYDMVVHAILFEIHRDIFILKPKVSLPPHAMGDLILDF